MLFKACPLAYWVREQKTIPKRFVRWRRKGLDWGVSCAHGAGLVASSLDSSMMFLVTPGGFFDAFWRGSRRIQGGTDPSLDEWWKITFLANQTAIFLIFQRGFFLSKKQPEDSFQVRWPREYAARRRSRRIWWEVNGVMDHGCGASCCSMYFLITAKGAPPQLATK